MLWLLRARAELGISVFAVQQPSPGRYSCSRLSSPEIGYQPIALSKLNRKMDSEWSLKNTRAHTLRATGVGGDQKCTEVMIYGHWVFQFFYALAVSFMLLLLFSRLCDARS